MARYLEFVRENGIEHAAAAFAPDVPVVAGMTNEILVRLSAGLELGQIGVTWPTGWRQVGSRPGESAGAAWLRVAVPTEALGDHEITATETAQAKANATGFPAKTRLHVVPRQAVRRVITRPSLDRSNSWAEIASELQIAHTNLWEGKTRDAADSAALVRLAQDGTNLFLEIEVTDDAVVSNIAPNDIKGHWRSDSVEICVDPRPGSEHTLGCFKLGIFPFDSSGKVRAARDADAHPGLVEETAPGTRLTSWKTDTGYVIRVAIPFVEMGLRQGTGVEVGFNVLIYDGDKLDAVPGENINKSRLAWAPRGGVQGRPDDWGRLWLE